MMKTKNDPAILMLEDGTLFVGLSCGASGEAIGEICFNTSVVGYVEIISDPSYAGQILVMTYPQVGNYGVARVDLEREALGLRGLVVRDMCYTPSSFRSDVALSEFLVEQNIVAIENIDTRALTQHIRDKGAMRALISTGDFDEVSLLAKLKASPAYEHEQLVEAFSVCEPLPYTHDDTNSTDDVLLATSTRAQAQSIQAQSAQQQHVVVIDLGVKRSSLRSLLALGTSITIVPHDMSAGEICALKPDGVFLSSGPGNPELATKTIATVQELLGVVALFGIGLGYQVLALAAGATIKKHAFGHHGAQPVMNMLTQRVGATAQNHGFIVDFASLGQTEGLFTFSQGSSANAPLVNNERFGRIQLTHKNLNDESTEGIAFLDIPAFGVQFHPESSPWSDPPHLYKVFGELMLGRSNCLGLTFDPQGDDFEIGRG